jgi:hypothetical protein
MNRDLEAFTAAENNFEKCSSLKHYATSQKVAGSISDEVIVFFN